MKAAKRSFWCWLRRKFLVWHYGTFRSRFPVQCPICGIPSWDPKDTTIPEWKFDQLWVYRCGHSIDDVVNKVWRIACKNQRTS